MKPLRVFEAFAGIGSQSEALKRLGIDFKVVGWADIHERVSMLYETVNAGCVPNSRDITKLARLPDCDLLTYSSPCQDFSMAGLRMGGARGAGTRSSLIWEIHRLLDDSKARGCLPKYLLLENVVGLVHGEFKPFFEEWLSILKRDYGYESYAGILDAQDFNVPQSRKRVFVLSVLGSDKTFVFPKGEPLSLTLRDMFDTGATKDYLDKRRIEQYLLSSYRSARGNINLENSKSNCLVAHDAITAPCVAELLSSTADSVGSTVTKLADVVFPLQRGDIDAAALRGDIVEEGGRGIVIVGSHRWQVRRLTPRECYRLMGWRDSKIDELISLDFRDNVHYFVCGNSIVVNCLIALFGEMLNQFEGMDLDWFKEVFGYSKVRRRLF